MGQLGELKSGAQQLAYQLDDPSSTFRAGLSAAANGGGELRNGLVQLRDGGQQVNDGRSNPQQWTGSTHRRKRSTLRRCSQTRRRHRATPCRVCRTRDQTHRGRRSGPQLERSAANRNRSNPLQPGRTTGDVREPGKHVRYRFCSVLPAPRAVRGRHHHLDAAQAAPEPAHRKRTRRAASGPRLVLAGIAHRHLPGDRDVPGRALRRRPAPHTRPRHRRIPDAHHCHVYGVDPGIQRHLRSLRRTRHHPGVPDAATGFGRRHLSRRNHRETVPDHPPPSTR